VCCDDPHLDQAGCGDGGEVAPTSLAAKNGMNLRRLRRENKQLRQERDILSKAAAWFAQNDVTGPRSSSS
jgi:transposase